MIRNQVYERRVLARLTQEELAGRVGVTRQTIIALEKHKYVPSVELCFKLARVFDTKVDELFSYEPSDPSHFE